MGLLRLIGNILWFIGGGLISFLTWLILGVGLCITIIGIPFGLQCLKVCTLVLAPFGKEVVYGGKTGSFLMNILWLPLGLVLCLEQVALGLIYCITIIGIPAGLQAFKMAKLALMPFGAEVRKKSAVKKEESSKSKTPATETKEPEPAPAQPTPTEAIPTEPAPAQPTSTQSAPTQSEPSTYTPAQPAPVPETPAPETSTQPSIIPPTTTQAATVKPASIQVPAETTPSSTPATPVPIPPAAKPDNPEDAKEEETEDGKPKFNPVIIIFIVATVLLILGLGTLFVMPFLLNSTMMPRESGTAESNITSNVVEPKYSDTVLERATNYCTTSGGTMVALGYDVSAVLDNIKADQYLCQLDPTAAATFRLSIAKKDYLTTLQEFYQDFVDQKDDYTRHTYESLSGYIDSLAVSYNAIEPATVTPIEDYPYYFKGYITSEREGIIYVVIYSDMLLQITGLDQVSAENIISTIGLNSTDTQQ